MWNEAIAAFVPAPDAVPGLDAAGAALGVFTTKGAMKSGQFRVKKALEALDLKVPSWTPPEADDTEARIHALWSVPGRGRAWLDFQNDVTVKDVKLSAQEGFTSVEHMKRYTTQGMATDQGKNSNIAALAVLADATDRGIPADRNNDLTARPTFPFPSPRSAPAPGAWALRRNGSPPATPPRSNAARR